MAKPKIRSTLISGACWHSGHLPGFFAVCSSGWFYGISRKLSETTLVDMTPVQHTKYNLLCVLIVVPEDLVFCVQQLSNQASACGSSGLRMALLELSLTGTPKFQPELMDVLKKQLCQHESGLTGFAACPLFPFEAWEENIDGIQQVPVPKIICYDADLLLRFEVEYWPSPPGWYLCFPSITDAPLSFFFFFCFSGKMATRGSHALPEGQQEIRSEGTSRASVDCGCCFSQDSPPDANGSHPHS